MKKVEATAEPTESQHPMLKSYKFISTSHVDYENLSAFEAVTMSLALVLAVLIGVIGTTV